MVDNQAHCSIVQVNSGLFFETDFKYWEANIEINEEGVQSDIYK